MQVDVKVPVLAESVSEATLMEWHKKEGDSVERGESLIDIETDKVTLEVSAVETGVLSEILKKNGETVGSDEVIARIDTEAKAAAGKGESGSESKTEAKSEPESGSEPEQQSLPVGEDQESGREVKASPAVRKLLQENDLSATDIPTNRSDGRLTKEDVVNYLERQAPDKGRKESPPAEQKQPKQPESATGKPAAEATEVPTGDRPEERVPMTRLRRRTAERLLSAQQGNAILTTFNEVNMKPVMDLRARYKEEFEKEHGIKLGFMSFFTKAAVEALKRFPVINASVDGDDIIYHGYFDIGMAVSTQRGLVVPILRDVDSLSFAGIEQKIAEFGQKAKDSKLTIEELTGGTFTITNGGIFGSMLSTPILNPPQSAILGMHKIQERPVVENGEVVVRPVMYLAVSYDHRIIDGREAVQFLVQIKNIIEDPSRLLFQI